MKYKWYLYCLINFLFLEFSFHLLNFNTSFSSVRNILLFAIPFSYGIDLIINLFSGKRKIVVYHVIFSILGIWFSFIHIFHVVYNSFFSICLLGISDQLKAFKTEVIHAIIYNFEYILLFFLPIIIFWILKIFSKKMDWFTEYKIQKPFISGVIFLILWLFFYVFTILTPLFDNPTYQVIYKTNNISISENKLGVISSTLLDCYKYFTHFHEEIKEVSMEIDVPTLEEKPEIVYESNTTDMQLPVDSISQINNISNYLLNNGTYQNEYTGTFKDMNVIYLVAESFSEIAVREDLTPTLYRLTHSGFVFPNYYTPNVLSTIGGEFQALTGLYPTQSILNIWRSGKNYFPYGLANTFKNNGYRTYAYHNNSYVFQNRNVYLRSMGFDNFKGCYNGMEQLINCRRWPQSDVDMIQATIDDYLASEEPFLAYYMTVSGHFEYNWDNSISLKWKSNVDSLPYSSKLQAYLATQMELDRALELLINKLTEVGKLDNTVIVLLADHYPYDLSMNEVNTLSSYERDDVVEVNHNNLIIWNSKFKNTVVDKVAMSIDVVPTLYNLLGFRFDSRLFIGKDIFSTENGLAIFSDRSWVTSKGTYFAVQNKFIPRNELEEISEDYIQNMNNIVANKINISQQILESNYYSYLNLGIHY